MTKFYRRGGHLSPSSNSIYNSNNNSNNNNSIDSNNNSCRYKSNNNNIKIMLMIIAITCCLIGDVMGNTQSTISIPSSRMIDYIGDDHQHHIKMDDTKRYKYLMGGELPFTVASTRNILDNHSTNDRFTNYVDVVLGGGHGLKEGGTSASGNNTPTPVVAMPLNLTGGTPVCNSASCPSNTLYWSTYVCSNDTVNWNSGKFVYNDPYPYPPSDDIVIRKIAMQLVGSFNNNTPSVVVLIDGQLFSIMSLSTSDPIACPNCVQTSQYYQNTYTNGLNAYTYGGTNTVQFTLFANAPTICLSSVNLTFYYGPASYHVLSISPAMGPSSGGSNVTITGAGFLKSNPVCRFGNISATAFYINDSTITCTSPQLDFPVNGFYNVTVQVTFAESGTYSYPNPLATFSYYYFPSQPLSNNKYYKLIYVSVGCGVGAVFLTGVIVYFVVQRIQKNKAKFIPVGSETQPLLTDLTIFEIKPIEMSEILIQNRIGRGSCAEVFTGTWRGITVAIKKAKLLSDDDEEFLTELAQEATIMSQLRHPNVCQFLGTCNNPPEVLIVMEFMARGSLYRILHDQQVQMDWPRMKSIALDIAKGMNYLHCCDPIVIHRDLKSHNLLVDEHFRVKISDFGLSTRFKQHLDKKTTMTPVGTPCWTAPEVLRNDPYTEKADIFSYAIVLWELVTREDPYQGMPTFQIVISVGQHKLRPIIPPHVSAPFTRLITECWSEDPSQRPSFQEIVKRLESL